METTVRNDKSASIVWLRSGILGMLVLSCGLGLAGCTTEDHRQSSDELREKTAETTAEVKRDAKSMAEGVKEGWNRDKERVDLNSATREELVGAGLTRVQSDRVIEHRPYASAHELLTKHVLSEDEYRQIEPRVRTGERADR
ncbi:MAG TPA: helix-hairpin-helix domain-containing protein [Candidatus Sulfotelmatobacter sp.]|jgi:hypothetical protein|nr:helix-hairpin-helix domain-containing protein [Candidatus Sulfotelmatobacter sp.]